MVKMMPPDIKKAKGVFPQGANGVGCGRYLMEKGFKSILKKGGYGWLHGESAGSSSI
jgi:hypothetical protein